MGSGPIIIPDNSGFQQLVGYEAVLHPDRCEIRLDVGERHLNRGNRLHGGVFATILDAACGYAASRHWSLSGKQSLVTLSLTVNYLAAGLPGPILAVGTLTGAGHKIAYVDGKVTDGTGALLATASGVFKKTGG